MGNLIERPTGQDVQHRQHGDNGAGVNRLGDDTGRPGAKKAAQGRKNRHTADNHFGTVRVIALIDDGKETADHQRIKHGDVQIQDDGDDMRPSPHTHPFAHGDNATQNKQRRGNPGGPVPG